MDQLLELGQQTRRSRGRLGNPGKGVRPKAGHIGKTRRPPVGGCAPILEIAAGGIGPVRVEPEDKLEQLRALAGHLQAAREEERTRIAREIHDELGQSLTALKMDVAWLKERLAREAGDSRTLPLARKVEAMSRLLDATAQRVRQIATELRPGILDHLGLLAAIGWLAQDFGERAGIRCTFATDLHNLELDGERSTVAFRIAQEALTNVSRHARATEVQVGLHQQGDWLVLDIEDNGRGASSTDLVRPHALGVLGMRERAALAGGDLQVVGVAGCGTRVTAWIPISPGPAV